jgi:hypothetical protein
MLRQVTFALLVGPVGFGHRAYARDAPGSASPNAIVLAVSKLALRDLKPAEAFARYAASDFIEHSQDTGRHRDSDC